TSISRPPRSKKLIWRVAPGVWETRARLLRPVSALTRLDLPALERPTKATSLSFSGGKFSAEVAPQTKSQAPAKSLRAASAAASASSVIRRFEFLRLDIVEQGDFHAFAFHDVGLLQHAQQVVPGVIDHQAGREGGEHEGEDHRHEGEHLGLHRI